MSAGEIPRNADSIATAGIRWLKVQHVDLDFWGVPGPLPWPAEDRSKIEANAQISVSEGKKLEATARQGARRLPVTWSLYRVPSMETEREALRSAGSCRQPASKPGPARVFSLQPARVRRLHSRAGFDTVVGFLGHRPGHESNPTNPSTPLKYLIALLVVAVTLAASGCAHKDPAPASQDGKCCKH